MYSIKQCKAYMKKNGVKGTSKFNKQQLNTKMLDVSNEKYKTRKNIKQNTTTSLVFQLTKIKQLQTILCRIWWIQHTMIT